MSTNVKKTSEIIQEIIATSKQGGTISIGEFVGYLGDKAFFLAILIFSLPNSLPVPGIPGFSTITGLPITFIALQIMLGRQTIWLPKKAAAKSFSREGLARLLAKALPAVVWLEKYLRPRWLWMTGPLGERLLALLIVICSLIIALPIPGGNFLPGLAMSLIALGMLERDGLLLVASVIYAIASIAFMYKIIELFFRGVNKTIRSFFQ